MMLDLSWVSTIPWVIGVFLLVKMLFSKADGALRIVSGLPVTGILRGLTIKASEMGVVLAAVTVSVLSISISLLLSTGSMRSAWPVCISCYRPCCCTPC